MKTKNKLNSKVLIISTFLCLISIGLFINPPFTSSSNSLKIAAPKNVLVYTEYADASTELPNTLEAINQSYGECTYESLTDYTNLTLQLPGQDILLIPEQEDAIPATCQIIGLNWTDTLKSFINGGGSVILLDYSGGTFHIYNSSNLMLIMGNIFCTGDDTTYLNLNSPLLDNVNGNFTLPNGSRSFLTNESSSVVELDSNPVVVHKRMGKGHIVLMGFDFFEISNESATILGNAIGLNPSGNIPGYDLNILIGLSIFSIGITLIILKRKSKIKN